MDVCVKLGFNFGWCVGSPKWALLDIRFWHFGKLCLYYLSRLCFQILLEFFNLHEDISSEILTVKKFDGVSTQSICFIAKLLFLCSLHFFKAFLWVNVISIYYSSGLKQKLHFCNCRISFIFWSEESDKWWKKHFSKWCVSVNCLGREKEL